MKFSKNAIIPLLTLLYLATPCFGEFSFLSFFYSENIISIQLNHPRTFIEGNRGSHLAVIAIVHEILDGDEADSEEFDSCFSQAIFINGLLLLTQQQVQWINSILRQEAFNDGVVKKKKVIKIFTEDHGEGVGYLRYITPNMNLYDLPSQAGFSVNSLIRIAHNAITSFSSEPSDWSQDKLVLLPLMDIGSYSISQRNEEGLFEASYARIRFSKPVSCQTGKSITRSRINFESIPYFLVPNRTILRELKEVQYFISDKVKASLNIKPQEIVTYSCDRFEDWSVCNSSHCHFSEDLFNLGIGVTNTPIFLEVLPGSKGKMDEGMYLYGFTGQCLDGQPCEIQPITVTEHSEQCPNTYGWFCFSIMDYHYYGLMEFDPFAYLSAIFQSFSLPSSSTIKDIIARILTFRLAEFAKSLPSTKW